jgi:transposase
MRVASPILLTDGQKRELGVVAASRTASVRFAQRARMILLAAEGKQDVQIAAEVGVRRQAVARWRGRFLESGIDGIARDAPRGGRKRSARTDAKVRAIVGRTTQTTPPDATHWSTRTMAAAEGVSEATVRRVWREHGLKPHRVKSFKLSNDKRFAEKLDDIVGLYLSPPEHAIVLCAKPWTAAGLATLAIAGFLVYRIVKPNRTSSEINMQSFPGRPDAVEFELPGPAGHREGWFFPGFRGAPTIIL